MATCSPRREVGTDAFWALRISPTGLAEAFCANGTTVELLTDPSLAKHTGAVRRNGATNRLSLLIEVPDTQNTIEVFLGESDDPLQRPQDPASPTALLIRARNAGFHPDNSVEQLYDLLNTSTKKGAILTPALRASLQASKDFLEAQRAANQWTNHPISVIAASDGGPELVAAIWGPDIAKR